MATPAVLQLALALALATAAASTELLCPGSGARLPPGFPVTDDSRMLVGPGGPVRPILHPYCLPFHPGLAGLVANSAPYSAADHAGLYFSMHGWTDCSLVCLDRRGLTVSGAGRVVSVNLRRNPIFAITPDAFADYAMLSTMLLSDGRLELGGDMRWISVLPVSFRAISLAKQGRDGDPPNVVRNGTFLQGASTLTALDLAENRITVIEPGGFDGLDSLVFLVLNRNFLPRIPTAALRGVPVLAELYLAENRLTGVFDGDFSGPWTDHLFVITLTGNTELVSFDPAAFAGVTGPLGSSATDFEWHALLGFAVVARTAGGVGGRELEYPAISINPAPVRCAWLGGAVSNLSCGECSFGYVRNDAERLCEWAAFGPSAGWSEAEQAKLHQHPDLDTRGELRLRHRLELPAPSLSADKKVGFVGYAGFDYEAISYELVFAEAVDLGCGTVYTNDSSADPPVQLGGLPGGTPFDSQYRIPRNFDDRPQYLRINVTEPGSFRFSACDSLLSTNLALHNRSRGDADLPAHPKPSTLASWDTVTAEAQAYVALFGRDIVTGSALPWAGGCELGLSTNRTIELDPGEYILAVRAQIYENNLGGVYYVRMECLDGGSATDPGATGDPGGITVDAATGAVSGTPERTGTNITMRLLARDALGKRAEVARWAFDVVDPKFDTISGWNKTTLDTNRRVTDKYHFDELHSIDGPADPRGIFENPANNDTDAIVYLFRVTRLESGDTDTADYDEWGNLNSNCSPVRALTDIFTGAGAFRTRCTGQHHATLTARDGGGAEAIVNEWDFDARPRDTDVERYGPNGIPCQRGNAIDGTPMDGNFTCDCTGAFSNGPNCEYGDSDTCNNDGTATYEGACTCDSGFAGLGCQHSDMATCNGNGKALDDGSCDCDKGESPNCAVVLRAPSNSNDTTSTVIGGVLGGVLLVVLAALVGLKVQVYVLKHRPVDVGAMQQDVIYSLGLMAAKNIGPLQFGITLTLAEAVDVVGNDQFREDLVAALRKASKVPKLSANLATATVTNVAAIAGSMAAGSNGATPAAHASHQVLVVISRKRLQRGVAESTVDTLVRLAAKGELRVGTNTVDDVRIAIPRVVPHEISRQALTRVKLLGEGEHGVVFQYQVHERHKGGAPYPVAAKTIKAAVDNNGSVREALLKEAALMALFDHRNVVALVGVCTVPRDVPALVLMALCDGGSLHEHLVQSAIDDHGLGLRTDSDADSNASEHSLSVSDRLTLCTEVLQGLEYLSNLRIVHRDIAARNVLLDSTGICKISDFGMSMSLHLNDEQSEYAGYVKVREALAIRWAAIEVLNHHRFSKASDVWAFGVLCWEVFADGRPPYSDEYSGLTDITVYIKEGGKLGSPSSDCPAEVFNELMLPCWEADPQSRPSARALYDIAVKHGADEDDIAVQHTVPIKRPPPTRQCSDGNRSLLGVSVEHLSNACVPSVLRAIDTIRTGAGHKYQQKFDSLRTPADADIWLAVESYGKPFSATTVCPRDGEIGSAYVDVASIQSWIRHATAFLSYTWGYKLAEVVATLVEWCEGEGEAGAASTWIWMDCFALNQHRIDLGNAATPEELQEVFGGRVAGIGRMVVMLDLWDNPGYVKRAWCLFELYTAIQNKEAVGIDVVLSPQQAQSFHDRINKDGTDAHAIDGALKDIKSENAEATVHADLVAIQALIQKTAGGNETINNTVRRFLRQWFESQGGTKVRRRPGSSKLSARVNSVSRMLSGSEFTSGYLDVSPAPSNPSTIGDAPARRDATRQSNVSPMRPLPALAEPNEVFSVVSDEDWALEGGSVTAVPAGAPLSVPSVLESTV